LTQALQVEHKAVPCVTSGHVVRFRVSGLQTCWAHGLQAYVPARGLTPPL